MLQRIQTIFILIAELLTAAIFKFKLADISADGQLMTFFARGISNNERLIFDGLPLQILIGIIVVLHIIVLFSFKKRIRQIRLLVFTIILLLGLFGLCLFFAYTGVNNANIAFKIPVAFPLVTVILDWLAIRFIGKDEALVRSLDRIR